MTSLARLLPFFGTAWTGSSQQIVDRRGGGMTVVGVLISSPDGLVIAADTAPGAPGPANDTVQVLNAHTACYV